jgi:hypothetical protein
MILEVPMTKAKKRTAHYPLDKKAYVQRINLALDELPAFLRHRFPSHDLLPPAFKSHIPSDRYDTFVIPARYGRWPWIVKIVNTVLGGHYTRQAVMKWFKGRVPRSAVLNPLCQHVLFVRQEWLIAELGPMREPMLAHVVAVVRAALRKVGITVSAVKQEQLARELYRKFWQ